MIRLGTRGSALALAQARTVTERLAGEVEIVPITTSGDERASGASATRAGPAGRSRSERVPFDRSRPDPDPADKSRFVKEIEEALRAGEIDIALHSAKDVPTDFPSGLLLHAILERADPRDALCGADSLEDLPEGAVVGTSSLRRRASLLALRPDLDMRDIRGNVDTRLRRLADGDFDALVLAQAGLDRLGRGSEGRPLDPGVFVPAAGQGCLAVQIRDADEPANAATFGLTDFNAHFCLTEERAVVRQLRATCNTPIGVHAVKTPDDTLRLTAFVGLPDGSRWIRDELEMPFPQATSLIGLNVAERLRRAGADELLAEAERAVAAG